MAQSHNATIPRFHNGTISQCYNSTFSQSHNLTMPQCCNRTIDADDGPVTGGWGWTTRDIRNHRLSIPRAGGRRATRRAGGSARARGIRVLHSPHSRAHARHPMIIAGRLFAARCRGIPATGSMSARPGWCRSFSERRNGTPRSGSSMPSAGSSKRRPRSDAGS